MPMSFWDRIVPWVFWGAVILVIAKLLTPAKAEEHSHDDEAGKFYSTWNRPDVRHENGDRYASCCNRHDCYATAFKQVGETWFAKHRETGEWIVVPNKRIEQNHHDLRESPDGRSHICASAGKVVFCAVLGVEG